MARFFGRRQFLAALAAATPWAATLVHAQQPDGRDQLREPVFRVGKTPSRPEQAQPAANAHPLDAALQWAYDGLENMRANVRDYTCTLIKRERIGGQLGDQEYMFTKIRNRKVVDGRVVTPLSVYMYFLKPAGVKGREVLYVEGANNGKMFAHEGGATGRFLPSVWLAPDGVLAMRGQRYPITDIGMENLLVKLIEKGERDRQRDECDVQFHRGAKINGRDCTLIQVTHPHQRPYFDFHVAQIFIDDELQVPVRYAAYQWPEQAGGQPVLDEEYTYLNLKLNVGLTDADFDPKNPNYNF